MNEQSNRGNELMDQLMNEYYDTLKGAIINKRNEYNIKSDIVLDMIKKWQISNERIFRYLISEKETI